MNDNYYLSIDPGETSGWATFDEEGTFKAWGQIKGTPELEDWLAELEPPKVVIIEEFRLYKSKALQQSGSKLETVQVIGSVKNQARRWKATIVEQRADVRGIAELYSGVSEKSVPHSKSHKISAMNHGTYYLVTKGIIKLSLDL